MFFFYRMPILITRLQGGLGNQMFQYAALRGISDRNEKVYFDIRFVQQKLSNNFETFTMRPYELDLFKNKKAIVLSIFWQKIFNSRKFLYRCLKKGIGCLFCFYNYKGMACVPIVRKKNMYLDGYFQSEKYFKHIRQELLEEFKFPEPDVELTRKERFIKSHPNAVAVHVRRGDYMKPAVKEVHGILPLSYYKAAFAYLQKNITNPFFIVFSDDPEWCNEAFRFLGHDFIIMKGSEGTEAWKDMYLMTCCPHHIIANSSFSWWGAWLSTNEHTIKIAPKNWFNPDNDDYRNHDIVPENWITL